MTRGRKLFMIVFEFGGECLVVVGKLSLSLYVIRVIRSQEVKVKS